VGGREVPLGLMCIAVVLFAAAVINLFTKETATISGLIFTLGFFVVFVVSEKITAARRAAGSGKFDQFQLASQSEVEIESLRCKPGGVLVPVRDYNTLTQLDWAVEHAPLGQDIVVFTVRLIRGPDGGTKELGADELFTDYEQALFTKVVAIAERQGRPVKLLVVPATNIFDAVAQAAVKLRVHDIVVGRSANLSLADQAQLMGDAWDRTPHERELTTTFVIHTAGDQTVARYSLGAHTPHLFPGDVDHIHRLWVDAVKEIGPSVHHRDIVAAALTSLEAELKGPAHDAAIARVRIQSEHPTS
jgi:hypothetical protein